MSPFHWICRSTVPTRSLHRLRTSPPRFLRRTPPTTTTTRTLTSRTSPLFQISEEVQQALSEHRPVVALETTIYTHGFPYPQNLALATNLENLVRQNGGIPATIGILQGVARVGLTPPELEQLVSTPSSSSSSPNLLKLSRRDLAFSLALRDPTGNPFNGGTTISGTMVLAHLAGIRIFATGGLGGVHRGAESSMDISADLTELGRTPLAVISSGCKAFLDIPRTLEYLETQGVAVGTFADGREGRVDFPAFYTRDSGVVSPMVLRDEREAARVVFAQEALGLRSGMHFANPIPEEFSLPFGEMEGAIREAIAAAEEAGMGGSRSTPFILAKIKEITGSRSVEANRALVEANVIRGTKVAVELRKLEMGDGVIHSISAGDTIITPTTNATPTTDDCTTKPTIFVAGSLAIDLSCDYLPPTPTPSNTTPQSPTLHTSNPAHMTQTLGGVGHNVARAAHLLGAPVRLCSAVGSDLAGSAALEALIAEGMDHTGIATLPLGDGTGSRTAQYVSINDTSKDLVLAMADMSILSHPSPHLHSAFHDFWLPQFHSTKPTWLILDGNWSPLLLSQWLQAARDTNTHILFEPVSQEKSTRILHLPSQLPTFPFPALHLSTPNAHELHSMHTAATQAEYFSRSDWWSVIDALGIPSSGARVRLAQLTTPSLVDRGIPQQAIQLLPFIPTLLVKLGAEGVVLFQLLGTGDERLAGERGNGEAAPYILSRGAEGNHLGVGGVYVRFFPAAEEVATGDVVSVNGVGDTFAGTLVAGLVAGGGKRGVEEVVGVAQRAAVLSLRSREAVSGGLVGLRGELYG